MQGNRVFVVRNGKLEHFYFPPPRQEGKQPSPAKKLTSIFSNRGSKKESASIPQDWVDGDCFFDSASQGGGASSVGQKPSPPTNQQAGSPHQQEDPQAVVNSKRLPQDPTPIPPGPGIQAAWTYGKW